MTDLTASYKDKDGKEHNAEIGDVIMAPGTIRGIVIGIKGTFVTLLAIGTSRETGATTVLTPRYIHDFPAHDCMYMPPQRLNFY